jgi:hypothetical protein
MHGAEVIAYDFRGDRLDVVRLPGGDLGVGFRRLCDVIPVDFSSQVKRLAREAARGARWAVVVKMTTTGSDGKHYEMLLLPRRSIPLFAASITLARVREDLRPGITAKLARYQDECAEALADHFFGARQQIAPVANDTAAPVVEALTAALARIATLEAQVKALARASRVDLSTVEGLETQIRTIVRDERFRQNELIKAGITKARERGRRVGRPPLANRDQRFGLAFELMRAGASPGAAAQGVGVSRTTVCRALRALKPYERPTPPKELARVLSARELPRLKREVLRARLRAQGWQHAEATATIKALGERIDRLPLDEGLRAALAARPSTAIAE